MEKELFIMLDNDKINKIGPKQWDKVFIEEEFVYVQNNSKTVGMFKARNVTSVITAEVKEVGE